MLPVRNAATRNKPRVQCAIRQRTCTSRALTVQRSVRTLCDNKNKLSTLSLRAHADDGAARHHKLRATGCATKQITPTAPRRRRHEGAGGITAQAVLLEADSRSDTVAVRRPRHPPARRGLPRYGAGRRARVRKRRISSGWAWRQRHHADCLRDAAALRSTPQARRSASRGPGHHDITLFTAWPVPHGRRRRSCRLRVLNREGDLALELRGRARVGLPRQGKAFGGRARARRLSYSRSPALISTAKSLARAGPRASSLTQQLARASKEFDCARSLRDDEMARVSVATCRREVRASCQHVVFFEIGR